MGKRILIVDDELQIRRLLDRFLTSNGGHITQLASDGQEGLERAIKWADLDLIITDVLMPRMTGVDMAKELRRRGLTAPILLISGNPGKHADELGDLLAQEIIQGFIGKPFDRQQLAAAVKSATS